MKCSRWDLCHKVVARSFMCDDDNPSYDCFSHEKEEVSRDQANLGYGETIETDPGGKSAKEPGSKLDAGKPKCHQILVQFSHALWEVSKIGTFGANKYTMGGWQTVDDGENRYADAGIRHWLKQGMGETVDPDSELLHLSHEAWNALAKLELYVRRMKDEQR